MRINALVYCEGLFGESDGKIANGLVRYSEKYEILGIIDSTKAGMDSGEHLDGAKNNIPVFKNTKEALQSLNVKPKCFIIGLALTEAYLPLDLIEATKEAMKYGMDIVNGLPVFLKDNNELTENAKKYNVEIYDIRKPKSLTELKLFTGKIDTVEVPVVAIFGLDCAIGKRTTCMEVLQELKSNNINAVFVATGQTGVLQGAKYGVPIDVINSQYVAGEIESAVVSAFENEDPDVILIEGQSSLSHPAYLSSYGIIKGAMPDAFIVQYAPKRKIRADFPLLKVPSLESEIKLIEYIAKKPVIGITINHENMSKLEIDKAIKDCEKKFHIPTTDVLKYGSKKITDEILKIFPDLSKNTAS
ncbi:DUF1611 domain-containing protein [Clostridium algidicarnis]|uniref:DUF1611 domain-containing protein n=1 Tax=Clostridium algidicarnis TaxID=37659 RepID=UPI001C0B9376|nr:DUF1611 domain-containing protein [Clostridium algidicarnis]MBU3204909.1 DUF1611 domain-containing protein [Clostridium algidicarnis]MBU3213063.1 DUF1611 domain-containing protein [Clostridium algidicarnis]MBU3223719.1 DUF1611 domain-containing protein [Clostridium algidicarnis]